MTSDVLRWVAADSFVSAPVAGAPSILRFASDDFMDRMVQTLAQRPQDLPSFRAKPEGWLAPGPTAPKLPDPTTDRRPRVARALARSRSLLGFERQAQPASTPNAPPLKLFQPVHQRFYLAAAHLVCERPGLPPHALRAQDRSAFVIRRLFPSADHKTDIEHGFVKGADGRGVWVPIAEPAHDLAAEESLLPVFPLGYSPPNGPRRALNAGLIPASQHDDYVFAVRLKTPPAAMSGIPEASVADRLKALALSKVIDPWQALSSTAKRASDAEKQAPNSDAPWKYEANKPSPTDAKNRMTATNNLLIEGSWRVLQEFREWLQAALPEVVAALGSGTISRPKAQLLLKILGEIQWPSSFALPVSRSLSLRAALGEIGPAQTSNTPPSDLFALLDGKEDGFSGSGSWPDFACPLALTTFATQAADPGFTTDWVSALSFSASLPPIVLTGDPLEASAWKALLQHHDAPLVQLLVAIHAAIDEAETAGVLPANVPQAPAAAALAKALSAQATDGTGPARFVLRFVHIPCDCGPMKPEVISERSDVFEFAGFFDPDAPLRPIRIALPFDTSPGGLRKYTKNSAFIVSDLLCGQMKRVRNLGLGDLVLSILPWPFHKDLSVETTDGPCGGADRFGMICSLSIPIITLVAFVLLIVIALLLDLIFHWLPFLMVCFPVPGLKGKKP